MKKAKILLVEDQRTTALKIQKELEEKNYEITAILDSGEKVLNAVNEEIPDLILMDIVLKGKTDGIEAAKEVQADHDIPIVYLTAFADEEKFERAILTEPFGYLIKPFEARELDTTIRAALYKHESEKKLKRYKDNLEKEVNVQTLQLLAANTKLGTEKLLKEHVEKHVRKLHRAIEQSPAIILMTDMDGIIEYINPTFTKITGYSFDEVIGQNPSILNSGKQSKEVYEEMWSSIKTGNEWKGEFCNRTKDGEYYWESVYISPLKDSKDIITNFIKTSEDITERRSMEVALIKCNRELDNRVAARTEELSMANKKLQEALDNVSTLSGLIPICATCKKIRDDKGYWSQVEHYIKKHSEAEFTHGICPDCQKDLLSGIRKD